MQAVRDLGDWESWLKFFLRGIVEVSQEAAATAKKIVELREAHRILIIEQFGRVAGNGLKVLESLYSGPIISVNDVAQMTKTSFTAANKLTQKFVEQGLLSEITGQTRNRQFRYDAYIDLFADER